MKNTNKDYYLGLDIGTDSVGWAVTDKEYNILEFRRKPMWGIHLFEGGSTAQKTRVYRTSRRRLKRRAERIALLRDIFSEEIGKVDPGFFERLDESDLHLEDRVTSQKNSLFDDPEFNDKDLHKKFPTIYHLRSHLMHSGRKEDIRLIYLAAHHIIKFRGHFLYKGIGDGEIPSFEIVLNSLIDNLRDEYGMELEVSDRDLVKALLSDFSIGIREKSRELSSCLNAESENEKALVDFISGKKTNMKKLFDDEALDKMSFSLRDSGFEDQLRENEGVLGPERVHTLELSRQIFEWARLSSILKDSDSISEAKIKDYDQHREDLRMLKRAVKKYAPDKYSEVFKSKEHTGNYCSYVYVCGKGLPDKKCSAEEFQKYLKKILDDSGVRDDEEFKTLIQRLDAGILCPKQRTGENSVIPYSVHRKELIGILNNAAEHYPSLSRKGEDGFSSIDKILMLEEFRIPYYVGPLDDRSSRSWLIRNSFEAITPWNFNEIVDEDETSERFIGNLTSMCTYLGGEKVLPKNSLLYSRFMLYNEINNLRVGGEKIPAALKNKMVSELFANRATASKVTLKELKAFLKGEGVLTDADEISGIDDGIKSTLRSEILIRKIIGDKISDREMAEEIVRILTVFGDERRRSKAKLKKEFSDKLTEKEIEKLSSLRFDGWGRLSEKFLTGLRQEVNGRSMSIIEILEDTNYNLQEILSKYSFNEIIDSYNEVLTSGPRSISYDILKDSYLSPAVKRGVWRALSVVKDILKAVGRPPKKIFVETTREEREKKRTESRKDALMYLYKSCKETEWEKRLDSVEESSLRNRSLYLYYTQLGKCMYCGKNIDIGELNTDLADRDHIYPQSKTKDDSIRNNLVLVCRGCNQAKGDRYPLPQEWVSRMHAFWTMLKDKGYISSEKYRRLTRRGELTEEEFGAFINRQLVETSQSAKAVITVLKNAFKDSDIVYVKGSNVSDFRSSYNFIKCRSVNDYHHAKDAYLNIVVGNVLDTKFTKNPSYVLKNREQYNIGRMYDRNVSRFGVDAWVAGDRGSIATVRKYMRRNNILFTRYATKSKGALFKETVHRKKEGLFERKKGLETEKYGGYSDISTSYLTLLEYDKGKKRIRSLEIVPTYFANTRPKEEDIIRFFSETRGLANVRVVMPKVRMKSLFEYKGFRFHVTGSLSGGRFWISSAIQLLLPENLYAYCKSIENNEKDSQRRSEKPLQNYGFSSEMNIELFKCFMDKAAKPPYDVKLSKLSKNLEEGFEKFKALELGPQVKVLQQILDIYSCDRKTGDLSVLGGARNAGGFTMNGVLSEADGEQVTMICQSPSGLFEKRVPMNEK
jgi:CRISPR-associated endonuclease Csn1